MDVYHIKRLCDDKAQNKAAILRAYQDGIAEKGIDAESSAGDSRSFGEELAVLAAGYVHAEARALSDMLLEFGADSGAANNAGKTAQKGIVETFFKKGGVNYNKRDELGNTTLFYACLKGARDIVKLLAANGADVTLANNENLTPLHGVAKSGNKEIMRILTDAGAEN
jgi:hypothetical protein